MSDLKEYTKDDLRKAVALFAYKWQTNIIREQLAREQNKIARGLTPKDFYDTLPTWDGYVEYDVEKLNKAIFKE
tara:strand:- start:140 stop:361 length:222 start_codon:yes stop_codon:yes gene_type:complete